MKKQSLLNTYVNSVNMNEAICMIESFIQQKRKAYVVAINVDVVIQIEKDSYLKKIADSADMLLVDGKPLIWISKLYGRPVKAKISGSDLVPVLCETAEKKGYTIFILGGKNGVADRAKEKLEINFPKIKIVGTYAPPLGFEKDIDEIDKINQKIRIAKPDILIVCFGCPKQEKFIFENYKSYEATVSVCAGATVDFIAGDVKRAPKWMSECGLEWLYRFFQEPRRMFKRYFIDDTKILRLVWKYRK